MSQPHRARWRIRRSSARPSGVWEAEHGPAEEGEEAAEGSAWDVLDGVGDASGLEALSGGRDEVWVLLAGLELPEDGVGLAGRGSPDEVEAFEREGKGVGLDEDGRALVAVGVARASVEGL